MRIDEALNPESERMLGRLYIEIGVRPAYPAEFIVMRIGIWDGGSSVQRAADAREGEADGPSRAVHQLQLHRRDRQHQARRVSRVHGVQLVGRRHRAPRGRRHFAVEARRADQVREHHPAPRRHRRPGSLRVASRCRGGKRPAQERLHRRARPAGQGNRPVELLRRLAGAMGGPALNAEGTDVAIEELELAVERLERG